MVKILTKKDVLQVETRPWGKFEILHQVEGYIIKRLYINPGEKISLQTHQYRNEHWLVESGIARAILGDEVIYMVATGKLDIPVNTPHRIENDGNSVLTVIEVQTGELLSEDDIIRIEDKYGRC